MMNISTRNSARRLAVAILLLVGFSVLAQQPATTQDGATVLLYEDGTWEYAPESEDAGATAPVTLELTRFSFIESGPENDYANDYKDWFDIAFAVTNTTDRDIRAARGVVLFQDLFGDVVWRVNLRISDPVPAGESINWVGSVDYQMFNGSHRRMQNMRPDDMEVVYDQVEVIYEEVE